MTLDYKLIPGSPYAETGSEREQRLAPTLRAVAETDRAQVAMNAMAEAIRLIETATAAQDAGFAAYTKALQLGKECRLTQGYEFKPGMGAAFDKWRDQHREPAALEETRPLIPITDATR